LLFLNEPVLLFMPVSMHSLAVFIVDVLKYR